MPRHTYTHSWHVYVRACTCQVTQQASHVLRRGSIPTLAYWRECCCCWYYMCRCTPIIPNFRAPKIPKNWGSQNSDRAPKIPTGLPKFRIFCRAEKKPHVGSRRGIMKMVFFNLIYQNCLLIHPIPFWKGILLPIWINCHFWLDFSKNYAFFYQKLNFWPVKCHFLSF